MKRILVVCAMSFLYVLPAAAQSGPYVVASVGADILRSDYTQSGGLRYASGSDEVLDVALRVGATITSIVGVEAEFSRSAKTESGGYPYGPIPLTTSTSTSSTVYTVTNGTISGVDLSSLFAPTILTPATSRRVTSFNALASARQEVGAKVRLMYLAGVAFSIQTVDSSYSILPAGRAIALPRVSNRFIDYGVDPIAGVDAHITLTNHVSLVAGARFQGLGGGWMVRPGVGLGWNF